MTFHYERAILHDPDVFNNPESFNPGRFVENPGLLNPADIGVFGYGRRACAGKAMALDTVWIAIASILYAFRISKIVRQDGTSDTPDGKLCHGTIRSVSKRGYFSGSELTYHK